MPIKGLSVHRGDVTRPVMVVVAEQGTERRISYPPVSADSVTVPVYRVRAGCDRPLP